MPEGNFLAGLWVTLFLYVYISSRNVQVTTLSKEKHIIVYKRGLFDARVNIRHIGINDILRMTNSSIF